MHVDVSRLDLVVISHAHGDHTSGLRYVLNQSPNVPLYVPDDHHFTGAALSESFLKTDARPDLPAEMRYFRGNAAPGTETWAAWTATRTTVARQPITVAPRIHLVALVSQKPAFRGLHEISLILDTKQGPVVFDGCSHPGIEQILASGWNGDQPVYMLFGGLLLIQDTQEQIQHTLTVLSARYRVQKMAAGHCTGELAFYLIQRQWGAKAVYSGLGTTVPF